MKRSKILTLILAIYIAIVVVMAVFPFLSVVSMSFSSEADVTRYGFSLIPRTFTTTAYEMLFEDGGQLLQSALWTLFLAFTTPALTCFFSAMAAYPISRPNFALSGVFRKYLVYTMLIGAGMIPHYIVNVRYYGLYDNPLVFFTGIGGGAWGLFLYRTFFKEVPQEMIEAAHIDGCSEFQTLWRIMLPNAKAIFAMQYTLGFIGSWNALDVSMYYIESKQYYQVQYYLKKILDNISTLKEALGVLASSKDFPTVTIQYAVLVVSLLPVFILFPYMQKFFAKGIAAGSVKG